MSITWWSGPMPTFYQLMDFIHGSSCNMCIYHHLSFCLHGKVDLTFNFDDPKNDFKSKLDDMLDCFNGGDLTEYVNSSLIFLTLNFSFRWSQFLVIITTHSDPHTGDLHIAPNNTGSIPVNEVSFPFSFFYYCKFLNFCLDSWCYVFRTLLQCITER